MKTYPILMPHFGHCTKKKVIFPLDFAYLNLMWILEDRILVCFFVSLKI